MLKIDGSMGEGGGQILRTSLSLSMLTGQAIRIDNIRAGRSKPGLMRQHLACVLAAQKISQAEVTGAEVGSTCITFRPNAIQAGDYEFSVGTAGSTLLIFQTVLPALAKANAVSNIKFYGGTHNMLAPSFDFIQLSFAPLLKRMGVNLEMSLHRHGFYPQGGGTWYAGITPATAWQPLQLLDAGATCRHEAVITTSNIPEHVAVRERDEIAKQTNWTADNLHIQTVPCLGSGNVVSLRLQQQDHCEVIEHVGRIGVSAERVAKDAVKEMRRYLASGAAVGEHLADQLLLPMAIGAGGRFTTVHPSLHSETNRQVIEMFLDKRIVFEELGKDKWVVAI